MGPCTAIEVTSRPKDMANASCTMSLQRFLAGYSTQMPWTRHACKLVIAKMSIEHTCHTRDLHRPSTSMLPPPCVLDNRRAADATHVPERACPEYHCLRLTFMQELEYNDMCCSQV